MFLQLGCTRICAPVAEVQFMSGRAIQPFVEQEDAELSSLA